MIKHLFQAREISPVRYMDNGKKCVIWGLIYDVETFAASAFNGFYGVYHSSANNSITPFVGGGFSTIGYGGNLSASLAFINPEFMNSKFPLVYPDEDNYVIIPLGTRESIIKVDEDFKLLQTGNSSYGSYYARNAAAVRLDNGDYVLVINESYYDRSRLFRRYNPSLQQVHDFKLNSNYAEAQIHYFDGVRIYASANGINNNGRHILYAYDTGTKNVTTLIDFNGASKRLTPIPSQLIDYNGKKLYFVIQPANTNALYYRAVLLDLSSVSATKVDFTADYGTKQESDVIYLNASERRQGIVAFLTKTDTGVYHLHLLFVSRTDYNAGVSYYRLVTYRVDLDNQKLIYKSHYEFKQRIWGYLPLTNDYKSLMINGDTANFFATFVPDKEEWTINVVASSTNYTLIDSLGRLFVYDRDGKCYPYLKTAPAIQYIELENKNIKYTGEPIDNNLLIDYFNYEGKRISVRVTIELEGALEFSDGSKKKTIETSATETTKVAVKCYGGAYKIKPVTVVPLT